MRRVVLPVLAMLLLAALPAGAAVTAEGAAAGWRQTMVIDTASSGASKKFEAFDTASLNLYDFNGDGQLEIVSHNDNNVAYVIDSRTGRVLAEIATFHYNNSRWPIRELNPIAVGDLNGDGVPCMVIPNSASYMGAWCFNKAASTATSFKFDKRWEIKVDAALHEPDFKATHPWLYDADGEQKKGATIDGHAYMADVDGDGRKEVFVETDGYPGQLSYDADGKYRWSRSYWDGNGGAKVLDIDKDGVKEAVFVSDAGVVAAYHGKTGSLDWVFESRKNGAFPGSIPVSPLVADLHGDGHFETVFGARNVSQNQNDPNWINESHARYFALDSKGRMLWSVSYDWMNPLQYNHPAPADVNGDGVLDVLFLDWNTVGHNPGDWEVTNRPSNLFALNGRDGSVLWRQAINVYWSNKDFVIADADGDGTQEVIAPTSRGSTDGLGVYDLKTGQREGWFPLDWKLSRGPVAGDLYGDGKLHLVVPTVRKLDAPNYRSLDVGLREGQLRIIATNEPYDVLFSANFHLSEDQKETQKGTVGTPPPTPTPATPAPATPTPASPTPPSPTTSTPPPATTPTMTSPPTTTTPPPVNATPSPTTNASPPTASPTPPSPTPTTQESSSPVPGPGAAALVAAACAGALVLARRRR